MAESEFLEDFARLFVVLSLGFVGGIAYMAVTRDLSPRALWIVGILGLVSLLLGILIGRESPTAIVHLLMVVFATVAIFAAVFWWYLRDLISAVFTLVAGPPAVVFSGLTLRRPNQRKGDR